MCEVCSTKEGMVLRRAAMVRKLESNGLGTPAKSDRVSEENVSKEKLIKANINDVEVKGQHECDVSRACETVVFRRGIERCRVW